jgi:hypothetical protein
VVTTKPTGMGHLTQTVVFTAEIVENSQMKRIRHLGLQTKKALNKSSGRRVGETKQTKESLETGECKDRYFKNSTDINEERQKR